MKDLEFIKNVIKDGVLPFIGYKLGSGCSATVYQILDEYNVKVFNDNEDNITQYRTSDAKTLRDLDGTNMFPEVYYEEEGKYIVKEHIEGYTLGQFLSAVDDGTLDIDIEDFYVNFKERLFEIVDFSFDNDYIPYDLQSFNIIVRDDGSLCVIDVGLFKKFSLTNKYSKDYMTEEEFDDSYKVINSSIDDLVQSCLYSVFTYYSKMNMTAEEVNIALSLLVDKSDGYEEDYYEECI